MKILMMTNTYLPHTGGVARSVAWFCDAFRQMGHRVVIVAPTFEGAAVDERDVVRVPALQNFNGSDFSVMLPIPGLLRARLEEFAPDVIHSHHPFLLGDTALRVAAQRALPIVFTHHTMYERYTHYVPGDSPAIQRFAVRLATEFANLCDHVIAPSESIATILGDRGVRVPITAIPTGIDREWLGRGDGRRARSRYGIPLAAPVIGHVGRLAPEKNLAFLTDAVIRCMRADPEIHFLLVGGGSSELAIQEAIRQRDLTGRFHHPPGCLDQNDLADAYHAMDVFAFASKTETQGMVLAEAMTAGVPVVALDAPGAREIVQDGINGRLLANDDSDGFARALLQILTLAPQPREVMHLAARQTAERFAMPICAERLLQVYQRVIRLEQNAHTTDRSTWGGLLRRLGEEWNIWAGVTQAVGDALFGADHSDQADAP